VGAIAHPGIGQGVEKKIGRAECVREVCGWEMGFEQMQILERKEI
jgi:hypothetical protein